MCPPGYKFLGKDEKTGLPVCQAEIPPDLARLGAMIEKHFAVLVMLLIGLVAVLLFSGGRKRR